MSNQEDKFKNYDHLRLPLDITSGIPNGISIMICKQCGAIVGETDLHNRWHAYGHVKFVNS